VRLAHSDADRVVWCGRWLSLCASD